MTETLDWFLIRYARYMENKSPKSIKGTVIIIRVAGANKVLGRYPDVPKRFQENPNGSEISETASSALIENNFTVLAIWLNKAIGNMT